MGVLDSYYRAFKNFRKETLENHQCEKDRREIAEANVENDKFNTTKYLCHIDEDWIKAIEEGLEFVEKAVMEERQFIRADGEVVPIEKVKRISKDTVEHLAKHSEMITHVPEEEGAPVTPDKLYMVEKLSDYAVYENRFLYMMLCYLRDFIEFRLEKIETLRRTYISNISVSKKIETKKKEYTLETKIYDKRTDNPYPVADDASAQIVKRITDCQSLIGALLDTDLMQQVAKSPMIKPPIVKTNVLKMNNNFKHALALYDYIASYKGLGFTYEEINTDFSPYSDKLADEMAEAYHLISFIAFKTGNGIEEMLESHFKDDEKKRAEEENKKLEDRLKRLKKRALESNKTLEEYMLVLEERNKALERDSEELAVIRHEVTTLHDEIDGLNLEKKELNRRITDLEKSVLEKEREVAELNQKYIDDTGALTRQHAAEVAELNTNFEQQLTQKQAEFTQQIQQTVAEYEARLAELQSQITTIEAEKVQLAAEQQRVAAEYERKSYELDEKFKRDYAENEANTKRTLDEAKAQVSFIQGQLDSIRIQQGHMTPSADYASRDRFIELQAEYAAFEKFFKEQWRLTKKEIRKKVLWAKPEKKDKKTKSAPEEAPAAPVAPAPDSAATPAPQPPQNPADGDKK